MATGQKSIAHSNTNLNIGDAEMPMKTDAERIIKTALAAVLPDAAVKRALNRHEIVGDCYVIAIGKAAYRMAAAANEVLADKVKAGIIITKYGHGGEPLSGFEQVEAGHPVPDENALIGAGKALALVKGLTARDTVVFLVSGGGSALFEEPLPGIKLVDIADVTEQLLSCGADIVEMNTIRKHLSGVKGGRFAGACAPARVLNIVLSDVLGDSLDSIASGPTYPDSSTSVQALAIVGKYGLKISDEVRTALQLETPKALDNVTTEITGNVRILCQAAARAAKDLGYQPLLLTTTLCCEARDAGCMVGSMVAEVRESGNPLKAPCALILGGETLVRIRGAGKGGRNQELALAAAIRIDGMEDAVIFSVGSDGTDGPTDAAGGIVDGDFVRRCKAAGHDPGRYLDNNDSYTLLQAMDALVMTGPTGTNVNDLVVALVR